MTRGMQELSASFVVAAVGATWGCWWIFLRLIEAEGISPGWTLAVVYGAAAIALIPLFACRWRHWRGKNVLPRRIRHKDGSNHP